MNQSTYQAAKELYAVKNKCEYMLRHLLGMTDRIQLSLYERNMTPCGNDRNIVIRQQECHGELPEDFRRKLVGDVCDLVRTRLDGLLSETEERIARL